MRKADYSTLAALIKEWRALNPAAAQTLSALARDFSDRASVDKNAFLKACGIEP